MALAHRTPIIKIQSMVIFTCVIWTDAPVNVIADAKRLSETPRKLSSVGITVPLSVTTMTVPECSVPDDEGRDVIVALMQAPMV